MVIIVPFKESDKTKAQIPVGVPSIIIYYAWPEYDLQGPKKLL